MQHLDLLLILNDSSLDYAAVQSELPTEASYDVPEYFRIVRESVRVERRHHTTPAQVVNGNQYVADSDGRSRPRALVQPLDARNHKIRPEPPSISPERCDRSIGRHQERQHVEPRQAIVANKL